MNATPRPLFQRRHYVALAEAIRLTIQLPHDRPEECMGDLIEALCDRFALDNPTGAGGRGFDRMTFRAACGFINGHDHAEAFRNGR
jgi:hypothetical protein